MANPYRQQVRVRKVIYALGIAALFTVSLFMRKWVIEPKAYDLQLREAARGEVELTGSFVRLALTGSRGLATTILWSTAIEKQRKHEYNELELIVSSIAKLQPYFVTPWIFQGWNLAYNVSVEWDQPLDKFYYVSRGMHLLAEGERRNQGVSDDANSKKLRFPGNPDMRFQLGNFYLMKFGSSDEKNAMRSLLDLSTIPPEKRDPARFWTSREKGRTIKLAELEAFCQQYPRLVRRLREQLGRTKEKQIVEYLEENKAVPSRFAKYQGNYEQVETPLLPEKEQFPILPPTSLGEAGSPGEGSHPDPRTRELTNEAFDLYLVARTWMQYAQRPLPEPAPEMRLIRIDPLRHRLPKQMAIQIFRGYPARCQSFLAENLESEGWFDEEGWIVRDWFDAGRSPDLGEVRIGAETKYHAQPAWNRAYGMYLDYGSRNGLYLSASQRRELEIQAVRFRKQYGIAPEVKIAMPPSKQSADYWANEILIWSKHYRAMTNFDGHFYQCDAERTSEAVLARKYFFQAERLRRFENSPEPALILYQKALPLWMDVLIQNPEFAKVQTNQEDSYEQQLKALFHVQRERAGLFRAVAMGMWQLGPWPQLPWDQLLTPSEQLRVAPIKTFRGPLDWTIVYDGPNAVELRQALAQWTHFAGLQQMVYFPGLENWLLTAKLGRDQDVPENWRPLISAGSVKEVRERLRLNPRGQ